jgi:hypothetical protein
VNLDALAHAIGAALLWVTLAAAFVVLGIAMYVEYKGGAKDDDPDPPTRDEYDARSHVNQQLDGYGLAARVLVACPFCGAAGFASWQLLSAVEDMSREATCTSCKRGSKIVVTTTPHRGGSRIHAEVVQTSGPDPPYYLRPFMRRLEVPRVSRKQGRSSPRRAAARGVQRGDSAPGGA